MNETEGGKRIVFVDLPLNIDEEQENISPKDDAHIASNKTISF